ncbi:carboxymuconolactone decarboxylase family protein [Xenophilus sp. Marseille-Q4582]|uniref:carboxymuconolactone decarboxylase family protein n=1 Tax=Xenophilus sp. Marseille-Q4582 TaxID=2866600 RepID=UPI001CE4A358|nr:carboxymuconolactone decarboxylase family protein [Xenophilus sp. Marseille-Q4582]
MTRLTLHTAQSAPEGSRPFVEKVQANSGFLPNLIGVLANAPEALETYLTVGQINAKGALNLAEREVVQITAARIHGCDFCVAGHTKIALKQAQLPDAQVIALQNGDATGDTRLDAVRVFTEAVIATRGAVDDAALAAFTAAGYNEQQALDVVLGVSLATLCNFANNLARNTVNAELQAFLPAQLQNTQGKAHAG